MAETLSELVVEITADASKLKKELQESTKSVQTWAKEHERQFKTVGKVLMGLGTGVIASFGLMAKAAADEQVNVARLSQTLANIGVSYDKVKNSLEAVINATQRKTGIADDQQRDVLSRLILVTNDYNKALELLPMALDLAAAGGMDAATAATYLGKAYLELEKGAESVSVRFGQASLQFSSMEDIQKRVAGAAEAMVNPFNVLAAQMGDISETIGSILLPVFSQVVDKITLVTNAIQNWVRLNPELAKELVFATAKLAGFSLALGSILFFLPKMITFVISLTGLFGPWGLAIAGVTLIVGYLVVELLGLTNAMGTIKSAIADVQGEMFKLQVEQTFSAERWAEIQKQGYLTETQFKSLAVAMKMTTAELYEQMQASGMLEISMTAVGDTNLYLARTTKEVAQAITETTQKQAQFNKTLEEGTKRAIATATWEAEGYTYQMSLFSQAEIEAAEASGKKIDRLREQEEITEKNVDVTQDLVEAHKQAKASTDEFANSLKALDAIERARLAIAGTTGVARESAILNYQYEKWVAEKGQAEANRVFGRTGLQHGGIVTRPTLGLIGEAGPEAVIPLDKMGREVNIFVELDSKIIARAIGLPLVEEIRARTGLK